MKLEYNDLVVIMQALSDKLDAARCVYCDEKLQHIIATKRKIDMAVDSAIKNA